MDPRPALTTRLSSKLTLLIRLVYAAAFLFLGGAAIVALADGSTFDIPGAIRIVIVAVVFVAVALLLHLFSFMTVFLAGPELVVRGYWREWRVPTSKIIFVNESETRGLQVVRIGLAENVPGLGTKFGFIPALWSLPKGTAAEALRAASEFRGA